MSRYKVDRSHESIPSYKVGGGHWRSVAVQIVSEPEICQGAGFILQADAGVRVQQPLQICLEGRSKSKKCDKQLTHIVRVSICAYFKPVNGNQIFSLVSQMILGSGYNLNIE